MEKQLLQLYKMFERIQKDRKKESALVAKALKSVEKCEKLVIKLQRGNN